VALAQASLPLFFLLINMAAAIYKVVLIAGFLLLFNSAFSAAQRKLH
jgi:hypothetical protein